MTGASKIKSSMNRVAEAIEDAKVEYLKDTEIVTIKMNYGTEYKIDTAKSVYTTGSIICLKNKVQKKNIIGSQVRDTVGLNIPGYSNNTRIALAKFIMLGVEKANGIERDSYIGLDANHMDRTGNETVYGYTNNRVANLEICDKSSDDRHWRCVDRLQKLMDVHFAFSANDKDLLDKIEFLSDEELVDYIKSLHWNPHCGTYKTRFINSNDTCCGQV